MGRAVTPAQSTHLEALRELCDGYNGSVSAEEVNTSIHGGRRQTLGSTVRVLQSLVKADLAAYGWNRDIESHAYWITQRGRDALLDVQW